MGVIHELTGPFVADGAIACQGGRAFTAFKPPGQQRNVLYEIDLTTWELKAPAVGAVPGDYFKSGNCALCFAPNGELLMQDTCSPDPTTGNAARLVVWQTGVMVTPAHADSALRNLLKQIARLITGALGQ